MSKAGRAGKSEAGSNKRNTEYKGVNTRFGKFCLLVGGGNCLSAYFTSKIKAI